MCNQIHCDTVEYLVVYREKTCPCQNRGRLNSIQISEKLDKNHDGLHVAKRAEQN
jgi:hypothetical protein